MDRIFLCPARETLFFVRILSQKHGGPKRNDALSFLFFSSCFGDDRRALLLVGALGSWGVTSGEGVI